MKTKSTAIALALLASIGSAQANDQTGAYVETVVTYARYEEPSIWFTNGVGALRLGYNFSSNFAVEVMGGTSLSSTNFNVGSTAVSAKFDSLGAAYLKAKAPVNDQFSFFGKLGVASGKVSASSAYGSGWVSGTDISYGVGMQIKVANKVYLTTDYTSYYSKNSVSITGLSAGVGFEF